MYYEQDSEEYYVDEGEQPTYPKPTVRKNQGLSTSVESNICNGEPTQIYQVRSPMNGIGKLIIKVDWMIRIDGIEYKLYGGDLFDPPTAEYIYRSMATECANGYCA